MRVWVTVVCLERRQSGARVRAGLVVRAHEKCAGLTSYIITVACIACMCQSVCLPWGVLRLCEWST
jgi:hypothetical protein